MWILPSLYFLMLIILNWAENVLIQKQNCTGQPSLSTLSIIRPNIYMVHHNNSFKGYLAEFYKNSK